jgi:MATE family multidrug resistance protein
MAFLGIILAIKLINWQDIKDVYKDLFIWQKLKQNLLLNRDIFIRTLAFLSTFSIFTNLSSILGTKTLAENALMLQVVTITVYLVDGLAYATECLVGIYQGENKKNQLLPLLSMAAKTSLVAGVFCASGFILFPDFLFGLLTDHRELVLDMKDYIPWLLPVLGLGSLAFILDGYYLGLAAGATLRNAALLATFLGFAPLAYLAWYYQSNTLLWLSMTTFMAARMISLGVQIPHTLKQ